MPDAGILATLLLLVGLFLLGLEFFIPSMGMILITACLSLIVSFWSAWKAWWGTHPGFFWTYIVVLVAGVPGSLIGAVTLMQKTSLGNRFILKPTPVSEQLPPSPLEAMIGRSGVTQTLMTPGGIVVVDGERLHAESIGMIVEPNTPVIVVGARANRVVVRPRTDADDIPAQLHDAESTMSPDASAEELRPASHSERLDFDFPQDYTEGR